jgi:hypothetical protein
MGKLANTHSDTLDKLQNDHNDVVSKLYMKGYVDELERAYKKLAKQARLAAHPEAKHVEAQREMIAVIEDQTELLEGEASLD